MTIENVLASIQGLLVLGFIIGLLIGATVARQGLGCLILFAVPIAMAIYVGWWQSEHPESLRSTSGLDFLFGPLWPSFGAIVGYAAGVLLRSFFERRR